MTTDKMAILTPDFVVAIGKVIDEKDCATVIGIQSIKFKKLLSGEIEEHIRYDGHIARFRLPDNSTYSAEFLKKAKAIIKDIKYTDSAELWQSWNDKKKCYNKNYPIMIRNEDLGIVIAPIIDHQKW